MGAVADTRRVIPAGEGSCERFVLPVVEGGAQAGGQTLPITASRLEELQRAAREEAFRQGHEEGSARGFREAQARVEAETRPLLTTLRGALSALSRPLEQLDDEVEQALVALAFACARQVVRRELRTEPGEVVAAAREALKALPLASREVRLFLHHEDVPLVRAALGSDGPEAAFRIVGDPSLTRGGCRVESEFSRIDASIESRMMAIVAQVLGGERGEDSGDE